MFKVVDVTETMVLSDRNEVVYKMVLIGSDGHIKKRTEFNGREEGSTYMSTTNSNNGENDRNWNNVPFEYNDCLYLWHIEPSRSIIKGKIKNAREDYSDGVNDIDNMNNVVFRLTPDGLESIYNEGPKIHGAEDKDVYQGEEFVSSEGVTYTDDFDNGHLRTNISGDIVNTNQLGPYTVTYTATDRWDKTTIVNRKITVRPNLYKNIFKITHNDVLPIQGSILIAEPFLQDAYFQRSVVLLIEHTEHGSMGFVLNKKTDLIVNSFFKEFAEFPEIPIYLGGPVSPNRLFFIHSLGDNIIPDALKINDYLYFDGDFNALKRYPQRAPNRWESEVFLGILRMDRRAIKP